MVRIIESLKSIVMPCRKIHSFEEFLIHIKQQREMVILTTQHCVFIAHLLSSVLSEINITTHIIFKKPKWGYSNLTHIVICPQTFKHLPVNFIAFQMEQSESSQWFTDEYFKKLNRSIAVLDYSLSNVEYLKRNLMNPNEVFYLPISINKECINKYKNDVMNRKYDVVFYGDDNSPRRQNILNILKEKYKVKIINGVFGTELYKQLAEAKIVINIHYYENALLETTRLYECLSLNNNVIISERGRDQKQHLFMEELVDFVDDGDVDALVQRIEYYLSDFNSISKKIDKNKHIIERISSTEFEHHLKTILAI